MISFSGKTNNW